MALHMRVRALHAIVSEWEEGGEPAAILIPKGAHGIGYGPVLEAGTWKLAVTWQGFQSGCAGVLDIPYDTDIRDVEFLPREAV